MTALIDTSFLFALANRADRSHAACVQVAHDMSEQLVVPITVLPEAAYLMDSRLGHQVMRQFVRQALQAEWLVETPSLDDLSRAVELLDEYADARLDFVDATIVAIAEHLNIRRVLTLDHRHFRMIRPHHCDGFELLPTSM